MKKFFVCLLAITLCSCIMQAPNLEEEEVINSEETVDVSFNFVPAKSALETTENTLAQAFKYLDVFVRENNVVIAELHQERASENDATFGSNISFSNLKKGNLYEVVAVGHSGNGPVTITNNVINFPDDRIRVAYLYKGSFVPTRSYTTNVNNFSNLVLSPIVSKLRFTTTDAFPVDIQKVRFTLYNTYVSWNLTTNTAKDSEDILLDYTNISLNQDRMASFNFHVMDYNMTDTTKLTFLVETFYANNTPGDSRLFENVPLMAGRTTQCEGALFTDIEMGLNFIVSCSWDILDTIEF